MIRTQAEHRVGELTLLLGSTGVDKGRAVRALQEFADADGDAAPMEYIDFERDYLVEEFGGQMWSYLDARERYQRSEWRRACARLAEHVNARDPSQRLIVGMHGVIVRDLYGARSPVHIPSVAALRPSRIVTLIDDLHDVWTRTEARAANGLWVGQPSLAQLLDARRMEILIGDLLAAHLSEECLVTHRVLAVKHPARELYRLLSIPAERARLIYLSFPIAGPRREAERGGGAAIRELNELLRQALVRLAAQPDAVAIVPVTVDELPVVRAQPRYPEEEPTFELVPSQRWNLRELWPDDSLLAELPDGPVTLSSAQVAEASGSLEADVPVRDYRLVEQSDRVLVINPVFQGELASGVRNEVMYGTYLSRPVHVFQSHDHDSSNKAREALIGASGALGTRPGGHYVTFYKSVEEAIDAAISG